MGLCSKCKKATSLGEPRKFTAVYLDIGDKIWMSVSELCLLRVWLSVPEAQVQARWVQDSLLHLPPSEHCGPRWPRCDARPQVGLFLPSISPT